MTDRQAQKIVDCVDELHKLTKQVGCIAWQYSATYDIGDGKAQIKHLRNGNGRNLYTIICDAVLEMAIDLKDISAEKFIDDMASEIKYEYNRLKKGDQT